LLYLDSCATTPCDPQVVEAISECLAMAVGNPSSSHVAGKRALRLIQKARNTMARLLDADAEELVVTSGATESNNLALFGSIGHDEVAPVNVVIPSIDHSSVVQIGRELERRGVRIGRPQVNQWGVVTPESIDRCLDEHTRLVSIAMVNSEIGTLQPVKEIGALCRSRGVLFHVDASQAIGRIPVSVSDLSADLLSMSGHKIYGPPGVGLLYVRQAIQQRLRPVAHGGRQQRLRSGTFPTALIVGLGVACELSAVRRQADTDLAAALRDAFWRVLQAHIPDAQLNNTLRSSVPHILNFRIAGVSAETLVVGLPDVAISSGSACASGSGAPSAALTGIGLSPEEAKESVRVCFGRHLTIADVELAASKISEAIRAIRGDTDTRHLSTCTHP
jgi:cysteine desulfurase